MDEQLIVDLIGNIDISLLEEDFMQSDVMLHNKIKKNLTADCVDLRRSAILDQIKYNERLNRRKLDCMRNAKAELEEKVGSKIAVIRKRIDCILGIISGMAAMIILLTGVIKLFIGKKSAKFVIS